jgi:hypothetical protein
VLALLLLLSSAAAAALDATLQAFASGTHLRFASCRELRIRNIIPANFKRAARAPASTLHQCSWGLAACPNFGAFGHTAIVDEHQMALVELAVAGHTCAVSWDVPCVDLKFEVLREAVC